VLLEGVLLGQHLERPEVLHLRMHSPRFREEVQVTGVPRNRGVPRDVVRGDAPSGWQLEDGVVQVGPRSPLTSKPR
jgi:hypothetical protein